MSSVTLNSDASALDQLRAISLMAQSSKVTTTGHIGMIGNRVVKFNTHWTERVFKPSDTGLKEMRISCYSLRQRLTELVNKALDEADVDKQIKQKVIASLEKKVGNGENNFQTLLDRSVVASVIGEVENALWENEKIVQNNDRVGKPEVLTHTKEELARYSSSGQDTTLVVFERNFSGVDGSSDITRLGADSPFSAAEDFGKSSAFIEEQIKNDCKGKNFRRAIACAIDIFSTKSLHLWLAPSDARKAYLELLDKLYERVNDSSLDTLSGDDRLEALLSDEGVTAALEAVDKESENGELVRQFRTADKESENGELVRQFRTALKTAEKSCRPIPENA